MSNKSKGQQAKGKKAVSKWKRVLLPLLCVLANNSGGVSS